MPPFSLSIELSFRTDGSFTANEEDACDGDSGVSFDIAFALDGDDAGLAVGLLPFFIKMQ